MEEPKKQDHDVKKAVKSRIKGLGLDALFHQVDLSQKEEYPLALRSGPDSIELARMIEKLKANFQEPEQDDGFQKKFQVLKQFFAPKPETRIGIMFGPSAVKLIELKVLNNTYLLSQAAYIPIPIIVKANEERLEKFINETVTQNFNLRELQTHPVYTIIPRSDVIVKFITFPTTDLNEIKKMIAFEAEHHLPLSLKEVEMDYEVVRQKNSETTVIVAAIKKEDLSRHLKYFRMLHITPDAADISSSALIAAMSDVTPEKGVTLQINIGSHHTDLNILIGKDLSYTRGLPWGSHELTNNLAENLNVSLENAENIKKENGIVLIKNVENDVKIRISQQASSWADQLINEIERTVQHFQLEQGQLDLNRIILTGGGTKLLHLGEYLKAKLKTKTMSLKLPQDIQIACNADDFENHFDEMSLIHGILKRGYHQENAPTGINLLPKNERHGIFNKKKRLEKIKILGCFAILGLTLLLLPSLVLLIGKANTSMQKKKISSMESQANIVRDLKNKIQTVEDYISTKHSCMALLKEVSLLVTLDITIDSLMFENNESISLVGEAGSHNSVVNLSQKLKESTHIQSANIRYTRKKERQDKAVEFEINCTLMKD